jgi:hypothetical protein
MSVKLNNSTVREGCRIRARVRCGECGANNDVVRVNYRYGNASPRRSITNNSVLTRRTPRRLHHTAFYSIFLLFPFGAGSSGGNAGALVSTGVRLYVTVLVTTSRTLTRREVVLFFSKSHVRGDMVAE